MSLYACDFYKDEKLIDAKGVCGRTIRFLFS